MLVKRHEIYDVQRCHSRDDVCVRRHGDDGTDWGVATATTEIAATLKSSWQARIELEYDKEP